MKEKNLLDLNLQMFADEEVADVEEQETVEPAEEETTETPDPETGEESGDSEPQEQSAEENARYAAIRRRAEEEAKRKIDAIEARRSQRVAAMCNGITHPITGQPITNVDEYFDALEIQQRQAQEQELKEKGVDPNLINRMVASNPTVLQAQAFMQQMQQNEAMSQVLKDVEEIGKLDPNVKSVEDLANAPYKNELVKYCQEHNTTLTDAYKILQFNNLLTTNNDAARQQAINQMRGKSHLASQPTGIATDDDDVEVPADIMASQKADGKTEKQIRESYRQIVKKLHLN